MSHASLAPWPYQRSFLSASTPLPESFCSAAARSPPSMYSRTSMAAHRPSSSQTLLSEPEAAGQASSTATPAWPHQRLHTSILAEWGPTAGGTYTNQHGSTQTQQDKPRGWHAWHVARAADKGCTRGTAGLVELGGSSRQACWWQAHHDLVLDMRQTSAATGGRA